MPSIVNCQSITKEYTEGPLFKELSINIQEKDKIGLIGPNGSGKSTLMKILAGLEAPDDGIISRSKELTLAYVPQHREFNSDQTIFEAVKEFFKPQETEDISEHRISLALNQSGFNDHNQLISKLSGGWRKRLSLACGLVNKPDLLLLDEPTNHLDLEGILWLERFLGNSGFAWIMISHDRFLLENVPQRIFELNPLYQDGYFGVDGSYRDLLVKREAYFREQQQRASSLKSSLRKETEWLNTNPKARGTKSKYRINKAYTMMEELAEVRSRITHKKTDISFSAGNRKSKKLVELKAVAHAFGETKLFENLDLILSPGSALGLLGLNGSGKTTLLRVFAKELAPKSGKVHHIAGLRVLYFDQHRTELDPTLTLKETLVPSGDSVVYRGRSLHLISWAKRFHFRPDQLNTLVGALSGGEQARLCIAKLMLQEADLLLLDEPANDLDIETLEALEESLLSFPGALVLVSHDRFMLNRVCKQFIGFDNGTCLRFAEYEQWVSRLEENRKKNANKQKVRTNRGKSSQQKSLSYLEQREYNSMEEDILKAESKVEQQQQKIEDPEIASNSDALADAYSKLQAAQAEVSRLYNRWEELEAKKKGSSVL